MSTLKSCIFICFFLFWIAARHSRTADAANILGLFTSHSPSHLIVHISLARTLVERGHNVTVVCSHRPKVKHDGINLIIIEPRADQKQIFNEQLSVMTNQKNGIWSIAFNFFGSLSSLIDMQFYMLKDERFTRLLNDRSTRFDLVIVGYFMNDFQLGVAAKWKCPVIVSWSGPPIEMINSLIGNPAEMSYVPSMNVVLKERERMNFMQRLHNVGETIIFKLVSLFLDYRMERFYNQLFPADNFPSYKQMKRNVSLTFSNSHFSEGPIRPNVPALIEIGGIQIKEQPDPLPMDIAEFLNAAKQDGAILFSLGSNLKGSNIKAETVAAIFKTLSSLPQKVIWKWDNLDKTPGIASNILYKKWLPQDDILAHPNLKLFITHAGKGGIAEAQYHAVPMLALPVFADQHSNAAKMATSGYGLELDILHLTVSGMTAAIKEIITNPIYANNIRKFSQLYRDRATSAKENVIYWTEYVLRYDGAPHLQSPLVHLNFVTSNNLDIILLLCIVVYILWRLAKLLWKLTCNICCGKRSTTKIKEH